MSSSGWSCSPSSSGRPQTAHRPGQSGRSSGAIGSASEIASRDGRLEVDLVVVGQAEDLGLRRPCRPAGRVARSIDGRYSSSSTMSIGVVSGRRQRAHSPASDVVRRASARMPRLVRREADLAGDRRGECEVVGQVDRDVGDVVGPVGADAVREQAGDVPGERAVGRRGAHRRPSRPGGRCGVLRLVVPLIVVDELAVRRERVVIDRRGRRQQRGAPLVEQGEALLDALEGLAGRRPRGPRGR